MGKKLKTHSNNKLLQKNSLKLKRFIMTNKKKNEPTFIDYNLVVKKLLKNPMVLLGRFWHWWDHFFFCDNDEDGLKLEDGRLQLGPARIDHAAGRNCHLRKGTIVSPNQIIKETIVYNIEFQNVPKEEKARTSKMS